MNKRFQEFINFHRRGKFVVFLFCLSFLFLILSQIVSALQGEDGILFFIPMGISFLIFVYALHDFRKNIKYIKKMENYLFSSILKTDINRMNEFHKLVDENLFQYYFQPIIDAKTGEVFAYEALMRTDSEICMAPTEILDYAAKESRLYDIEKLTFYNTLKIMSENPDIFHSKKLFINSISNHLLKDTDFEKLYNEYGPLFKNVVMEITESSLIDDNGIKSIQKRLQGTNCQLALDDYGTGYSNESILLHTNPNYIKIDQSLLRNINADPKKQHLVTGIVSFASKNHIKTIAEGIETYEEFVFVINLGVDYIQGFYTGKPNPVMLQNAPEECIDTVFTLNRKHYMEAIPKRTYETTNNSVSLSLVNLALTQFTDVNIHERELTLYGNHDITANISLHFADNLKCQIVLDNINLQGNGPSISLGYNCSVTMVLAGENVISYDGIRVPETSDLTITGNGNLTIRNNRMHGTGIGGTFEQSYGNINLAGTGTIKVINGGEMPIGIGGGHNTAKSVINLISGDITVEVSGHDAVGIGNFSGDVHVNIGDCNLTVHANAKYTVAIGSQNGRAEISTSGNLDITCEARKAVVIGVLENGTGVIDIIRGTMNLRFNAHEGTGIGGIGGNMDIHIHNGDIDIYSEGTDVTGVGDNTGEGKIIISEGIISTTLYAAHPVPIGNRKKEIMIEGGNIQCDLLPEYNIINLYGTHLMERIITSAMEFKQDISIGDNAYVYSASRGSRFADIRVYLPEEVII